MKHLPTPAELDRQAPVHVDEWVEIGSPQFQEIVGDLRSFHYILKMGLQEPAFLHVDNCGRLWGKGDGDGWFPFHDVVGGKTYGYKMSARAPN